MVPAMQLVIDLPPREEQLAFNRRRWEELSEDPQLAAIPCRIETNALGQILMSPLPAGEHSYRVNRIILKLTELLGGLALPECPVSTIDGVRGADVGWYSDGRFAQVKGQLVFELAPEICIEALSPSNTEPEMREKRKLYFEAGALEFWLCAADGAMSFFSADDPEVALPASKVCPEFPEAI